MNQKNMTASQSITSGSSDAEKVREDIQITFATLEDVDSLVALHYKCFPKNEHIAMRFGRSFIVSTYKWFITSPKTFVVIAKQGGRLIGFQSVSEGPYNAPMLRASWREALIGLIFHPWLAFHPELLKRLLRLLFRQHKDDLDSDQVGELAFIGVDPQAQGMGIGKALVIAAIRACRERGMRAVTTGVRRQNMKSLAMLKRAGLVEIPELGTKRFVYLGIDFDKDAH
jgi:ribosomal protein S18 acetylase RimI-like enzyme